MSDKPILFSAPMVRAILAGTKTVTRRVIGLREFAPSTTPGYDWTFRDKRLRWHDVSHEQALERCPFQIGQVLWCRETWHSCPHCGGFRGGRFSYRAGGWMRLPGGAPDDGGDRDDADNSPLSPKCAAHGWRPSIYMPRAASRLSLAVESVRIERLQEITEAEAEAEGVAELDGSLDDAKLCARAKAMGACPEDSLVWFAELWDSINGKRPGCSWSDNPYVWRVQFRRAA